MQRLTNLTNSPHPVTKLDGGRAIIPAFDSLDGDFDQSYVALLVQVGAVRVEPIVKKRKAASNVEQDSAEE